MVRFPAPHRVAFPARAMVEVQHIEPPPRRPERPGQILEATCRAILDRGFPATRISDIAREAGMSTGAVHYYFQGKDDVLVAALRYSGQQLFDQLDPVVEGDASELAKLAILLELATPFPGARRDSWQLWIELWTHLLHEPHLIPECEPISARWRSYFFTIVRRGTDNGEFDPGDRPRRGRRAADRAARRHGLRDRGRLQLDVAEAHPRPGARLRGRAAAHLAERTQPALLCGAADRTGESPQMTVIEPRAGTQAMTAGALLVRGLEAHGVEVVFGIPGTHNLAIYRALGASAIRHVTPRHEQGAGYAADGYARASGRPGVAVVTTGPAVLNAATAAAQAWSDSVPLLLLAPGMPRGHPAASTGYLHEMLDQRLAMSGVVERAVRAETHADVARELADAFAAFATGRPRSRFIEIPLDLLEQEAGAAVLAAPRGARPVADSASIDRAADLLAGAARPLLLAGGGAHGARPALADALERGVPVLTSINGKGCVDEHHPLALGARYGLPAAQELIEDADVLIMVGTELGQADTWRTGIAPRGRVIRIDLDRAQAHGNVAAEVALIGDAGPTLGALLERARRRDRRRRMARAPQRGRSRGRGHGAPLGGRVGGARGSARARRRSLRGQRDGRLQRRCSDRSGLARAVASSSRPGSARSATRCRPRSARSSGGRTAASPRCTATAGSCSRCRSWRLRPSSSSRCRSSCRSTAATARSDARCTSRASPRSASTSCRSTCPRSRARLGAHGLALPDAGALPEALEAAFERHGPTLITVPE